MLPTTLSRPRSAAWIALLALAACKSQGPQKSQTSSPPSALEDASPLAAHAQAPADGHCSLSPRSLRHPAGARLVAIGDIHGDLAAARRALLLAGAIDDKDQWIGGALQVVQTGDLLDRGNDEEELLGLLESLETQAGAAGGALFRLNGNHELMNAMGDFRYVTRHGFEDFAQGTPPSPLTTEARARAFFPGGEYARKLAAYDMVTVVGRTVFVHGGVLARFVDGLDGANLASRCFLLGERETPPDEAIDPEGPLWTRLFSRADVPCDQLQETLDSLGVDRMVVGHTPQLGGITSACEDKVWRIDTGMASYYGGPTQVLEIEGDRVRVLE